MAEVIGPPTALQVELTSRCNLSCPSCPLTSSSTASSITPGHMSAAVWADVAEVARRAGHVYVAGFGEPLTHPGCLDMLAGLDRDGVTTSFVTNGVGLSRRKAEALTSLPAVTHVNVSIDSPDPEVYRAVRGGALAHAVRGLETLMATGIAPDRVTVSTVVGSDNAESLLEMPALLARTGVPQWVLQGLVEYNEHSRGQRLPGGLGTEHLLDALRARCDEHGIAVTVTVPDRLDLEMHDPAAADRRYFAVGEGVGTGATRQCMVPWQLPYIDKDGKVHACCFSAGVGEKPLGDLTTERFDDVWTGGAYRDLRTSLLTGQDLPASCRACTAVPWGPHPLRTYSAEPLAASVDVRRGVAVVRYRNTGTATWTPEDRLVLGTSGPRDTEPAVVPRSWLGPNRPARPLEAEVAPGGVATFRVDVPRRTGVRVELVAEGLCWVEGTAVELLPPGRARDLGEQVGRRGVRALRRLRSAVRPGR